MQRRLPLLGFFVVLLTLVIIGFPCDAFAQSERFEKFAETTPKAGETAPDFTLKTLDGEVFNLSEAAADQPVVIEFGSYT
jgi:hypothetical protein